jgi:RNA polymerase sigma factor (sigma-70 family)
VDEVLQDSFLRALKALREGTDPRNPIAWIFVVTLNAARDHRRRGAKRRGDQSLEEERHVTSASSSPAPSPRLSADPFTQLDRREARDAAERAVAALGLKQKEVFILRVSAGLSFDAIGEALGIPTGTAKTRMRTALRELRSQLQEFAPGAAGPERTR